MSSPTQPNPTQPQDGKLVQLGDKGKLLEQGTQVEVEVEMVQPPKLAAARQVRERTTGIHVLSICNGCSGYNCKGAVTAATEKG